MAVLRARLPVTSCQQCTTNFARSSALSAFASFFYVHWVSSLVGDKTVNVGGQYSSHDADIRFGGLSEALVSTPSVFYS